MKSLFLSLLALVFATSFSMAQSKTMVEAINQTVKQVGDGRGYTPEQQEKLVVLLTARAHDSDAVRKKKLPKEEQEKLIGEIHKECATQINELMGKDTETKVLYNKVTLTYRAMMKNK